MTSTSHSTTTQLVDETVEILRERIVEGRLAAEASLPQRRLAADLNVARAVVGEALRMLHREGLVDGGGVARAMRVAPADRSGLLSAYVVREVLDGLAARLAASYAGPAIQRRCHAALEDQRKALRSGHRLRYMRADHSFHMALLDGAGNSVLDAHWSSLRSTMRSVMLVPVARLRDCIEEHEAIFAAVSRGHPDHAERAVRTHLHAAIDAVNRLSPADDRQRRPRGP